MNNVKAMLDSPRCKATSKRTGRRCLAPAVSGWKVCRFHGARGGAPSGPANGSYRNGQFTKQALASRAIVRRLLKQTNELMAAMQSAMK
jgi:hypothetical protein